MSDTVGASAGADESAARPSAGDDELERLRRMLVAGERDRLGQLERRLADPDVRAEELSRVLPEAIARASSRDSRIAATLASILEDALGASVRKNRLALAEILAPAMGPAIRRAIAEALRGMVDSFNQVLQYSLSPGALRWRVEAWRSGRPFAEVVLSHSLVFRVEQVFMVHRATGLLLQHVSADAAAAQDADLVSGMLTAIQDFVRDSFSIDAGQAVDTMRVGELAVWVEQGQHAYLAAVVRGVPPTGLRAVLRDALDAVHVEFQEALEAFAGDASTLDGARHHLEGCLQFQLAVTRPRRRWLAPAIAAGVLLSILAVWLALSVAAGRRWDGYLARLGREPGIVVTRQDGGLRKSSVAGLADPYAVDPTSLLGDYGLDVNRVSRQWKPYVSLEPPIVLARAKAVLQPPPSVRLSLAGGTLSAAGEAPHRWVVSAAARAAAVPGVVRFDADRLVDAGMAAVRPIQARLEALVVRFDVGSTEPRSGDRDVIDRAAAVLADLSAASGSAGIGVAVDVVGHTDGTGSDGANVRLSRARSEWVVSALEAKGLRHVTLAIVGVGASRPLRPEGTELDRSQNRSVTFHVGYPGRMEAPE